MNGWDEGTTDRSNPALPPPPPPPASFPEPLPSAPGGRPPGRARALLAAVLVAAVLTAAGIGVGLAVSPAPSGSGATVVRTVPQSPSATTEKGLDVQAVASRVSPAIVDVNTTLASVTGGIGGRGAGTGIVLTSSGEVLTNNHVIRGATSILVSVPGHGTHPAEVLGASPQADVALLQIRGVFGLPTATLADSSSLTLGEEVVAIGNALGQGGPPTVTAGTITALHRAITASSGFGEGEHLHGLIQTDAPISPGDSGGALVNSAGQVVGMITAGAKSSSASTNVGFAIPTNAAVAVVDQIRAGRSSASVVIGRPGFIGVEVAPLDPASAAGLGLSAGSGVLVAGVIPGTPAARAGILPSSVITAVDGRPVTTVDALGAALHGHRPGEQVRITWVDGSGTHTAILRLIAGPAV